jgi:hypothetical protein
MSNALRTWLDGLEKDRSLQAPARLLERIELLDRLDAYFPGGQGDEADLVRRARAIRERWEALNRECYAAMRREIQRGNGRKALLAWRSAASRAVPASGDEYDALDELIGGVLQFEQPGAVAEPAAEMVFYQPTPARHVFDLIDRLAFDEHDVLIDLGAGLGHVPLLVALCTDARCIGIELEAAYVECASRSTNALNLSRVAFITQDARTADLSAGTVFYLYTPFTGSVLRTVLDALRREASRRPIRVCTFGPCTPMVAAEPWLDADGVPATDRATIFRFSDH